MEASIEARHSVRKYKAERVPRELMQRCLEHAVLAPSAMGKCGWQFHVVEEAKLLQLFDATRKVAYNAPAVVFVALPSARVAAGYEAFDAALAVDHFCIAATHLGLGTCILTYDYPADSIAAVRALLGIPAGDYLCPVAVACGFPAADAVVPVRKRRVDVIFHSADA